MNDSVRPHLYTLVRIRKSGSQSLVNMIVKALPQARLYSMPPIPPVADMGIGFFEGFRLRRRVRKRLRKLFKVTDYTEAWKLLNKQAVAGDIVSGHFMYGSPELPDWEIKYITLLRDPVGRLSSEYRYCRQSYLANPPWRRWYLAERLKVAGKGSLNDYVKYLVRHGDRFANPMVGYLTGGVKTDDPYEFLCENYFHYGTLEQLDLFAKGLSEKVATPIPIVWSNKTREAPSKDEENLDVRDLERLIGKDLALYQAVQKELADVGRQES